MRANDVGECFTRKPTVIHERTDVVGSKGVSKEPAPSSRDREMPEGKRSPSTRTSAASLAAEEGDTRFRARRGLAMYFAVLVPLTAVFESIVIISGDFSVIWALIWTPAAASVVARVALREGFADVSFRLGGRREWKAVGVALLVVVVMWLMTDGSLLPVGL